MSRKLLEKNFCVIPWTGFELETNGDVKNCIISKDKIGNIKNNNIEEILKSKKSLEIKKDMLELRYPSNCDGCYFQEKHRNKNFNDISSRIYYAKEIGPHISEHLLDNNENFELRHIDLRWSNRCNQACVYCNSNSSSKWAKELGVSIDYDEKQKKKLKKYVFNNIKNLKNIYMAGGEPLLMNENKELLNLLLEENSDVHLRINTNLSHTNTGVFELIKKFKNVHWTVSVESTEEQYDYIRFGGNWKKFLDNLKSIQSNTNHKISFNMLYFILNYDSIFDCVNYLKNLGFHNNSFVVGPLYTPIYFNILNLPDKNIQDLKKRFIEEIDKKPGFILQNSYENILKYLDEPFDKNLKSTYNNLKVLDKRRNINSEMVFPKLYKEFLKQ